LRIRTFALIFSASLIPLTVLGQDTQPPKHSLSEHFTVAPVTPVITIEADSFNLFVDQEKAIFRGNVNASQGNHTFRTSQLTMHLDQVDTKHNDDGTGANSETTAAPSFELSARNLTYELSTQMAVGRGDSLLRRGRELISAELINYDMSKRVAYAIPDKGGRVLVRFFSNPDMPLFPSRTLAKAAAAE
jgi:lipopolysaccharide transport protein LptA